MEDIYTYKYKKYKKKYLQLQLKGGMKKTCTDPWKYDMSEFITIYLSSNDFNNNLNEDIFKKSFESNFFSNAVTIIQQQILILIKSNSKPWVECKRVDIIKNNCYTILNKLIIDEVDSTAYMLRVIKNSIITISTSEDKEFMNKTKLFSFYPNMNTCLETEKDIYGYEEEETSMSGGAIPFAKAVNKIIDNNNSFKNLVNLTIRSNITGKWKDDYCKFKLNLLHSKSAKLILAFGPSASGKTFSCKKIIEILNTINPIFPSQFATIDGGIARESSIIYKMIISCITHYCKEGISNLDKNNLHSRLRKNTAILPSLFPKVKKKVFNYFLFLKNNSPPQKPFIINLYVPLTLASCTILQCKTQYQKYIDLTGNMKWIGLNIWQHKKASDCNYIKYDDLKCTGCKESGEARERKEGKKYSSSNWQSSYNMGLKEIMNTYGSRYDIHNSGRKNGKMIITDYSLNNKNYNFEKLPRLNEFINNNTITNNFIYRKNNTIDINTIIYGECKSIYYIKNFKEKYYLYKNNEFILDKDDTYKMQISGRILSDKSKTIYNLLVNTILNNNLYIINYNNIYYNVYQIIEKLLLNIIKIIKEDQLTKFTTINTIQTIYNIIYDSSINIYIYWSLLFKTCEIIHNYISTYNFRKLITDIDKIKSTYYSQDTKEILSKNNSMNMKMLLKLNIHNSNNNQSTI